MQLVLAQVSDAEALQRYEDVCKDAEETDVLPFAFSMRICLLF